MEENYYDKTILIVDDTPENIDVLTGLLEGFKKKVAINGEKALKIAFSKPPDLILLDIMMPNMDGYEVCKHLREKEKTKDIPIIFLTAKTAIEDVVKGFEVGGQDYVTKPFDARELMERVKTQLQLQHQKQMLRSMNEILDRKVNKRTKQLNESNLKLEKANKELINLNNARNNFLHIISHELRTPLNGIVGFSTLLKDLMPEDSDLIELVNNLNISVNRLEKFSKTALEITQMRTVGKELKRTNININSVIAKVIESKLPFANARHCTINATYDVEESIIGIGAYFKQTIEELVSNAIKFSNERSVIRINTFKKDAKLMLSIINTGEVVPEDKIEEITKPFGMVKEHDDNHAGLGLAFVKTFLDIHDASIEIKSSEEETVITLFFDIL